MPVPRVAAPSLKATGPVGMPEAAETVAVNVTACPALDGLGEDESAVVVGVRLVCGSNAAYIRRPADCRAIVPHAVCVMLEGFVEQLPVQPSA